MSLLPRLTYFLLLFTAGCVFQEIDDMRENRVELHIISPAAGEVFFHSSESQFAPQPTRRQSDGHWSIRVNYREQFSYFFTVDGVPAIPDCDYREQDNFGNFNCIYPAHL